MKYLTAVSFAFLLCLLFSCTGARYLTSAVKPNEITELQVFETFSKLYLIDKGNKSNYSDTISVKSKEAFYNALMKFKDRIPITGDIYVADTMIQRKAREEITLLCMIAERQNNISNLRITPVLDSLLEKENKRFGLITIATGFTRDKGNYGGQIAKGAALGILTLGMYYQVPIKANSTIYAMIVDSQENNIAFFRKSVFQDKEPLDADVLKDQVYDIFVNYFWIRH